MSEKELKLRTHSLEFGIESVSLCSCREIPCDHWRVAVKLDAEILREDLESVFRDIAALDRDTEYFRRIETGQPPPPEWHFEITIRRIEEIPK